MTRRAVAALVALALIVGGADARSGGGFGPRQLIPAAPGVLDALTVPAYAAYGLRKMRSAHKGAAMNVRRSSDNATLDIGFDAFGRLNTKALLTFCAATSCYVAVWYDQSGNARDISNATTANQPQLVASGAYGGWADFTVSSNNGCLSFGSRLNVGFPYTANAVMQNVNSTGGLVWGDSSGSQFMRIDGTMTASKFNNLTSSTFDTSFNGAVVTGLYTSGSTTTGYANGVLIATGANVSAGYTVGLGCWGSLTSGGGQAGSRMKEAIVFSSLLSTADRQSLEHSQEAFYGIAGQ